MPAFDLGEKGNLSNPIPSPFDDGFGVTRPALERESGDFGPNAHPERTQ